MTDRNKFGWSYPPGAEHDPNAPYNQHDHHEDCPLAEDAEPSCECGCAQGKHNADGVCLTLLQSGKYCACDIFAPAEAICKCQEIAEDAQAAAADAAEARREELDNGL